MALTATTQRFKVPKDIVDGTPFDSPVYVYGPDVTEDAKLLGLPGHGKTTQLALRFAILIVYHDVDPFDITWVTYRKTLAEETIDRLVSWHIIDGGDRDAMLNNVNTLHSIASRNCMESGGSAARYSDKKDFCKRAGIQFHGEQAWEKGEGELFFDAYAWLKKNCRPMTHASLTPAYDDFLDAKETGKSFHDLAREWEAYKQENRLHDFWEMLDAALTSDKSPPMDVLVIDEMHDAYPLFMRVVEEWAPHAGIVLAAGDPNQVVNAFDGSDPRFFQQFDLETVVLPKNYRTPRNHWNAAVGVLSRSSHDPPEPAEFVRKSGRLIDTASPQFVQRDNNEWETPDPSEAYSPPWIVENCRDDAVLFAARTRRQMFGIGESLKHAGILFRSQKRGGGWNESTEKRLPLYNALQKLSRLGPDQFDKTGLGDYGSPLARGLDTTSDGTDGPEDVSFTSTEAYRLVMHTHSSTHRTENREESGELAQFLKHRGDDDDEISAAELQNYVTLDFWHVYCRGPDSVDDLVTVKSSEKDILRVAIERNDDPVADVDDIGVRVYTIHGSKGAEARTVVLYDGITQRIEDSMFESSRLRDNEYRTWFVGLTRSKENLFVLRDGFEGSTRFLPPLPTSTGT